MPTDQVCLGRKRPVPSCPNPLFLQWLTELRGSAKEKGLKTQYVYQKKYPLPLKNGKEAKILLNFGDGICKILDERLQKHYRENGSDAPIHLATSCHRSSTASSKQMEEPQKEPSGNFSEHMKQTQKEVRKEKGAKKKREYVPQKRSGGYAVLLTLYRHTQMPGSKGFMFRNELQTEAQPLCEKSFTVPDLGSKYTAWSSVSTLIQKVLLVKTHNPARYSLTDQGLALAEKLDSEETGMAKEHVEQMSEEEDTRDGPDVADLTLEEEDEEDQEEKESWGSSGRKQELVKELQRNGVTFDVRKLNVGDFLWVAPEKVTPVPGQLRPPVGIELVLDYITERKRMDDLCGSIIDGRFREQKFRLKRCGLRKPIYLVEECGPVAAHLSIPESTLQQAIVNTQVVDGFFVKHVQDVKESAAYLTIMTRYLQKLYQNCTLFCRSRELVDDGEDKSEQMANLSCSLMAFTELKSLTHTNSARCGKYLHDSLCRSVDKATAVLENYSTVSSLLQAYDQCSDETDKEKLLSSIKYGKLKRNIGPASSRTIYQLYCTRGPLS
ncbi:crossover junction endonuclease MUS81-like [Sinocyclocheilus anshuiensis]|uniref:crossover junction endonuclease MUS81-like n=1 Tax=Sinocyclocheilus anshuiensis TaxID=1608454 RepID=UPI0007B9BA72|nr:PREDICTED: crossover junction endonuclease MUS81-like [Sinocyclocheilus anshuiensis]